MDTARRTRGRQHALAAAVQGLRRAAPAVAASWATELPDRRKSNHSSWKGALRGAYAYVDYFCQVTTLHGFRYITWQEWHWTERLLWCALCCLALATGGLMLSVVWSRYQYSPTVITVDTLEHPISEVPFPGVTLCNGNKVDALAAAEIVDRLAAQGVNRSDARALLHALPSLVRPGAAGDTLGADARVAAVEAHLTAAGTDVLALMRQVAQPCERMVVRCVWRGRPLACSALFRPALSVEGVCCTFNYYALHPELDLEPAPQLPGGAEAVHVRGARPEDGLTVLLDAEPARYWAPLYDFYGITALFHDPSDYPEESLQRAIVQPGAEVHAMLGARVVHSEEAVRRLDASLRKCWFDEEVLRIVSSPEYSFQTCLSECRAQKYIDECDCIPFFYPRIVDVRFCGIKDVQCIAHQNYKQASISHTDSEKKCNCLPQCSDKFYSLMTATTNFSPHLASSMAYNVQRGENMSVLKIFFAETRCLRYRRSVVMTWDVLLATFGGVIGLCLGGSVLSLMEVFYFFTVKLLWLLICNIKHSGTSSNSSQQNFVNKIAPVHSIFLVQEYTKSLKRNVLKKRTWNEQFC